MINKVGVIGAGQMGNGIAHVTAVAGMEVILSDVSIEQAAKGKAVIEKNLGRQVTKGQITPEQSDEILERIDLADNLKALADCDLVIEAATENEAVKIAIFKELCETLNKDALIASNTSSISITRLASNTDRPDRFMGVHFMNPVPIMKLVELIRGIATSEETFKTLHDYTDRLGKITATAEDFPGFIVNRILMPMINEAIYTLYEGVGSVRAIDRGMELGTNHPMGPLTLADFIGLDTCLAIMQVLYEGLADSKYRPCPLLVKYVEAGWLGRKSGRGFYDYTGEGEPTPTR
ncbi:3-hydroxybutyryl-CoA dehydrogenase [Kordiimonas sp. SCSIO 12610]|uniref:3-hydroxybutyryl-CoA dehydrogenase n=1 Tax=Kordiimonas sp. SCSIO 12610 TaxID=2829597 RepID=UPI00210A84BC|nr:3-hydroxybutyryl-CoA dehydrogenase [Kordiimonas sp. SCSIO 12610]UTW55141.1 3-hydroxybutyryl-CoA dehydrogenase [Kordiimonas sp. SCSIO 12610]